LVIDSSHEFAREAPPSGGGRGAAAAMAASSDLVAFGDSEQEFKTICAQLPTRINTLVQYESNADKAQGEIRRIMSELATAKQRVSDMEMANRSIPEPTRKELGNKIRGYKDSLATLQKDLKQAEDKFSRSALMAGRDGDRPLDYDKSKSQRDRMQETTDKLRGSSTVLDDANRRIEETLEVGVGVVSELDRNRETLNRVRGNAGEVGGQLDVARRILRGMNKRELQNKIAVVIFAIVMIGIIGVVIYYMTKPKDAPK
jgi:chromosome segregation ATPase